MKGLRQALLVTAMSAVLPTLAVADEMKAEVLHWWTSGGESAAVKVFADAFTGAGGEWIDSAIAGGQNARNAGVNRIVGGNPPTVMQFNTGEQFRELVANDLLASLDDVADAEGWRATLPDAIVGAISNEGSIYAVPVNIHGQNWLWTSNDALEKAGIEPPQSFDALIAAAPQLREAGIIPLAHGGQNWQDHVLFDAVLLATGGRELMDSIYSKQDAGAAKSDAFRKAAETFANLRELTDEGSPGRSWNESTSLVITGQAAAQVMGDWAKGEFIAAGLAPGDDYGCSIMPGGYMMGGDVFVFPKISDDTSVAAQKKMASLMLSPDTQVAFNTKKGSVPVRLDLDVSAMDACAQSGMAALQDPDSQVPSHNFASPDLVGSVRDVITQYWNTPSMGTDAFVNQFVGAMEAAS